MKKIITAVAVALVALSSVSAAKVQRNDASTDLTGFWNETDVTLACKELINGTDDIPGVIQSPRVAKFEAQNGRAPTVIIGKFKNLSSERIDTSIITRRLETVILNSGVLEFVASKDERDELREEKLDQAEHSSMDTAKAIDNEEAADFMLTGSVNCSVQDNGKMMARDYEVTMILTDIESHKKIWQGQCTPIHKLFKKQKVKY